MAGMTPEVAAIVASISTLLLTGLGWLIRRKLVREPARERTALFSSLADMTLKLREAGLSLEEVRSLEAALFEDGKPSVETVSALAGGQPDDDERLPSAYFTTALMQLRARARLATIDNQIEELLVSFEGLLGPEHPRKVRAAYEAWFQWRSEESELAAVPFAGGSIGPLLIDLAAIKLSEEYLDRLQTDLAAVKELARSP